VAWVGIDSLSADILASPRKSTKNSVCFSWGVAGSIALFIPRVRAFVVVPDGLLFYI
jgi:hypothetical protein